MMPTNSSSQSKRARSSNAHIVEDQSDAIAFLSDPKSHRNLSLCQGIAHVQRIDTHGAMVFLAGERAFKLKRAVHYPNMDFSTLEKRRLACERELLLNRRTAPDLYLSVQSIVRRSEGDFAWGETGDVIDWVVAMRRFDESGLLDRVAQSDRLTPQVLSDLTDEIIAFHEIAEVVDGGATSGGGAEGLHWALEETIGEFREHPEFFPMDDVSRLSKLSATALANISSLLDQRLENGFVRRCHGDLHLRNVCLIDGRPTIFDAIEFNDRIACIDVLYDLAFLLMDLDHRGLRRGANLVLNRYMRTGAELEALAALPCFMGSRAAIRAKVSASTLESQDTEEERDRLTREAKAYFSSTFDYLTRSRPHLVAVGGLSGSGKTHLARILAPRLGTALGAIHLRSDVIRKQVFGVDELTKLPESAYTADVNERVYGLLRRRAETVIAAGWSVIVDAVHSHPDGRDRLARLAESHGASFTGLWLEAPQSVLIDRVTARTGDASDATPDVIRLQSRENAGPISWLRIDTSCSDVEVVQQALEFVGVDSQD